jgi:hypothetical protein
MKPEGILGAFIMAIGGAILFDFLYKLATNYFQNFLSPELPVLLLGFVSFLFLALGLLLIIEGARND